MVFSSVPSLYLDPPNWQQHPNQHQLLGQNNHQQHDQNQHHQLIPQPQQIPQPQPQPQQHQQGIVGGPGPRTVQAQQIRPNSMAEQARQLRIPPPEAPRKCPRCDSTNTKFCYYNNYNLLQPRHFCKTCRRYWTHGGALRNVPVGGGCRRNKKTNSSKSSSNSKALVRSEQVGSGSGHGFGSGNNGMPYGITSLDNIGHVARMGNNMGLNFNSGPNTNPPGITAGGLVRGGGMRGIDDLNLEFLQRTSHHNQHQVQFPNFLGGFEIPGLSIGGASGGGEGLYSSSFQNDTRDIDQGIGDGDDDNVVDMSKSTSNRSQVKMEDNKGQQQQEGVNNMANHHQMMIMGISSSTNNNNDNNQFNWGVSNNMTNNANVVTSMWTDLSGLSSSSTGHLV